VSDGSSLTSRLLGHDAFILTRDGPVYRPPQLAHAMTVHRYQQRRRSQGHSAAAAIDGGRDDAACLPNMCVNEFLDGHGCATGIGATRHGQPSTLRWQAVRPPHANDRRLGGHRTPAARFCRRPETSSRNTISQAWVQPGPRLAAAAVSLCRQRRIWSEHWTVATAATPKPLRPDTSQYCFRRHFKGSPSSDRAYGRQRTHLSARLGALAFADACTATTASWLTLSPRQ
jgi:hypothetical protein